MSRKIITILFIVFFSIMLWIFISFSNEYFYTIRFPIKFTGVPEGYAISEVSDEEVTISLKGLGWQLAQMTFGRNPEFSVAVKEQPGTQSISLRNAIDQNTWLSTAVEINEFSPTTLYYNLEKINSRKVPVASNISINSREGFNLVSPINISPDSVEVTGPASLVASIDTVYTVNKEYDMIGKPVAENIKLEEIENITYSQYQVNIDFDVQKIVDKEFQDIIIEVRNTPPSKELSLVPNKINVLLRGGINKLGKLQPEEITAFVKFSQALKDTLGYIVPTVNIPDYTELVDIKPKRIEYIIQQY